MKNISKSRVLQRMHNRINRRNKNLLIAFLGETGSGKSWSGLKLAEKLDPTFDIDRVVFTPAQFMHVLNNPRKYRLKKGSVIVWDETGVNFGARDFFKEENKNISKVLQTFRHKNLGLILTVPHKSFIDTHARKLLHYEFITLRINEETKEVETKCFQIQVNPTYKSYSKYPKKIGDKGAGKVSRIHLGKPSPKLIKRYEAKKEAFTKMLNKSIESQFKSREKIAVSKFFDIKEAIKYVSKNPKDFLKEYRGKQIVDKHKVSLHFNVGDVLSKRVVAGVKIV